MDSRPRSLIVCGYFTPSYESLADRLRGNLDDRGIVNDFQPINDQGSWRENLAMKPGMVLSALKEHGDILWLDADADLFNVPETWVWDAYPDHDFYAILRPPYKGELGWCGGVSCGTMYLRATDPVMTMIARWPRYMTDQLHVYEEPPLYRAFQETPGVCHFQIPGEYLVVQRRDGKWVHIRENGNWGYGCRFKPKRTVFGHYYTEKVMDELPTGQDPGASDGAAATQD